jgi:hypothetical protein
MTASWTIRRASRGQERLLRVQTIALRQWPFTARPRRSGTPRRGSAFHPSQPFATVVVEGRFGVRRRQGFAYSGRSLNRMSAAATPSTPASAAPGSAPCRTGAVDLSDLVAPAGGQSAVSWGSRFQSALRYLIPRFETSLGFCGSWALRPAARGRFAAGGPSFPGQSIAAGRLRRPQRRILNFCGNRVSVYP